MTNNTQKAAHHQPAARQFEQVLETWQDGQDTAWSELMSVWVSAPAAPRSTETIERLIKHLDGKAG